MNLLFWAFLAGSAAVAFPLVFHLIRRTPRGRQQFSSLMFLRPSPPRLTRRSRLDNLLLLLLRALAIVLIALAFTRPFFRFTADASLDNVRGRRIGILVDTSASMRRGDLWRKAKAEIDKVLDGLEPSDEVALYAFDADVRAVVDFEQDTKLDVAQRRQLVRDATSKLSPTWADTDVGGALATVADTLDVAGDVDQTPAALQVVLITDLQQGARLDALQAYEWPQHVHVAVHALQPGDPSNARVTLLANTEELGEERELRVRVKNAADSSVEQFRVAWSGKNLGEASEQGTAFYVPPGQSRVLNMPRGTAQLAADRLLLEGDAADFDNVHYVAPVRQQVVRLACIGSDAANDAKGLRYYLERALAETPQRKVIFDWQQPGTKLTLLAGERPSLVVVTDAVSDDQRDALQRYAQAGGTVLVVLRDDDTAGSLTGLLDKPEFDVQQQSLVDENADAPAQGGLDAANDLDAHNDYAMLGEIDFTHPMFAPFAAARYNDFTKIHFWRHRQIALPRESTARIIARFDNGDPAIWEQPCEAGKVIVMTSGWHPRDSQLALSTKFVPMIGSVLEQSGERGLESPSYTVGDTVPLPTTSAAVERVVHKPGGAEVRLSRDASVFDGLDEPGIYRLSAAGGNSGGGTEQPFAVNIAAAESETAPMAVEPLEQLGVKLGTQPPQSLEAERLRQLRDTELEGRQQVWKWLIVGALCVLGIETCLAGWQARRSSQASGESTWTTDG